MKTAAAMLGAAIAMTSIGDRSANAQQATPAAAAAPPPAPSPAGGLQLIVTPLLVLPQINSTVTTRFARAPTVDSSVGAFQLLGHLQGVPFMGAVEIRDGPFSLWGDTFHVPVGTNITTRNIFFDGGTADLTVNQGTADFLYHWVDQPGQTLDGGVGFRAWGFTTKLTLNGRLAPTTSITRSAAWADPLIAVRYHRDFGNRFGLTVYADFGGFGVGAHTDWQISGTIDYTLTPWATLRIGYLSLNFNYSQSDGPGFNAHLKGPMLAANFKF